MKRTHTKTSNGSGRRPDVAPREVRSGKEERLVMWTWRVKHTVMAIMMITSVMTREDGI